MTNERLVDRNTFSERSVCTSIYSAASHRRLNNMSITACQIALISQKKSGHLLATPASRKIDEVVPRTMAQEMALGDATAVDRLCDAVKTSDRAPNLQQLLVTTAVPSR